MVEVIGRSPSPSSELSPSPAPARKTQRTSPKSTASAEKTSRPTEDASPGRLGRGGSPGKLGSGASPGRLGRGGSPEKLASEASPGRLSRGKRKGSGKKHGIVEKDHESQEPKGIGHGKGYGKMAKAKARATAKADAKADSRDHEQVGRKRSAGDQCTTIGRTRAKQRKKIDLISDDESAPSSWASLSSWEPDGTQLERDIEKLLNDDVGVAGQVDEEGDDTQKFEDRQSTSGELASSVEAKSGHVDEEPPKVEDGKSSLSDLVDRVDGKGSSVGDETQMLDDCKSILDELANDVPAESSHFADEPKKVPETQDTLPDTEREIFPGTDEMPKPSDTDDLFGSEFEDDSVSER